MTTELEKDVEAATAAAVGVKEALSNPRIMLLIGVLGLGNIGQAVKDTIIVALGGEVAKVEEVASEEDVHTVSCCTATDIIKGCREINSLADGPVIDPSP